VAAAKNVVLVTGGLGDIGAAIAAKFLNKGWRVAVNDVRPQHEGDARVACLAGDAADAVAAAARYFATDNADRVAVEAMAAAVERDLGAPPSLVIVNAGVVEPAPFLETSLDNWRRHLDVNLTGAFHVAQTFARAMVRAGNGGTILFTGSWVQEFPEWNIGAYCVSKAGLKMLARQMALELAAHNIRVNLVAPGKVDAGLSAQMFRTGQADPALAESVIPLRRLQTAADVADAFWLLAQPEAAYVTGATLLCDGGMSLFNWQRR
jgi:NAD(P)-dependent dehydrogenase (short-subunit alcohol dehydrogenase family)